MDRTIGTSDVPPVRKTRSICCSATPALASARSTVAAIRSTSSAIQLSNMERVTSASISTPAPEKRKVACCATDNSRLSRPTAS
jgi:hypothetical protein